MTTGAPPVRRRNTVAVEWVYVRYRTVLLAAAALLLAAAGGLWLWPARPAPVTEEQARAALEAASTVLHQARNLAPEEPALADAQAQYDGARAAFDRTEYPLARDDARSAEVLARALVDGRPRTSEPGVRITRVDGDVRVKRAGQFLWETASDRDELRPGDQVRTGAGSAQLVYFDDTTMTISPGTLLEIRELFRDQARRQQRVSEQLEYGELSAQTQAREGFESVHVVATDSASVEARRPADFLIRHDRESGSSEVVANRGELSIEAGGREIPVVESTRVRFTEGRLVERAMLLDPPTLISPADERGFAPGTAVSLAWGAVGRASSYRVQLSDRPAFSGGSGEDRRIPGTTFAPETVGDGTYYWRVVALDPAGREGRWSESRKFRVLSKVLEDADDRTPPTLTVSEIMVVGTNAIVSGRAEPGALVWVDGERVEINDEGRFTCVVRLREDGENRIKFVAQDAAGNESRRIGTAILDVF
jgi:hypothetical protein